MKYIRTLKNIEKLLEARPQYVTTDVRFGTEYITYSDSRYEITIEKNQKNIFVSVNDREHSHQYYDYRMSSEGWQFDKVTSVVTENKEINAKLKADLKAIEDGFYKGVSFQEYDLSKEDIKTILDMVYTFTTNDNVIEVAKILYDNIDDLDARIVYKHKSIVSLNISCNRPYAALTMRYGEWNAYLGGMCIFNLDRIPDIVTYVLYDNFHNPYLEQDRVRPLLETENTEVAETIENNDQVATAEIETAEADDQVENTENVSIQENETNDQANRQEKWLVTTTGHQPNEIHNNSNMLTYDSTPSQALTIERAPPSGA